MRDYSYLFIYRM